MKNPDDYDLEYIQRFLESAKGVNDVLAGRGHMVCGSCNDPKAHSIELVTLSHRAYTDTFSCWLGENAMLWLDALGFCRFMKVEKKYGTPSLLITGMNAAMSPVIPNVTLKTSSSSSSCSSKPTAWKPDSVRSQDSMCYCLGAWPSSPKQSARMSSRQSQREKFPSAPCHNHLADHDARFTAVQAIVLVGQAFAGSSQHDQLAHGY
jgi:hypothetical protein